LDVERHEGDAESNVQPEVAGVTGPDLGPSTLIQRSLPRTVCGVEVRGVVEDEFADVGSLLVRAYESAWGRTGWDEYRTELLDVEPRAGETLVAVVDGVIAGAVVAVAPGSSMRSIADPRALEIRMLGVDSPMQRRGIAAVLLGACRERAISLGLTALVLQSDDDLHAAHLLYGGHGFSRREDLDADVGDGQRALGFSLEL
jgi:GNAT superfamily N-acetyltransferase